MPSGALPALVFLDLRTLRPLILVALNENVAEEVVLLVW